MRFWGFWIYGKRSHEGFTLLELAIIGMLMVSGVGLFAAITKRQREVKTKEEMESIREAVMGYYENNLVLPSPDSGYIVPVDDLDISPNAQTDEIYAGKYYAYVSTNDGLPFSNLLVDGQSIGNTGMVLISSGTNLKFDENNSDLADGVYTQDGTSDDFDDILIYLSANELVSSTAWRREIEEEVAVLDQAAEMLAENDDDGDGFVDEDSTDAPDNSDSATNWSLVSGMVSLVNAGLVWDVDHLVNALGTECIWDLFNYRFYSAGPNRTDESCGGDDIRP